MKTPRQICVLMHRYIGLFMMPWLLIVSLSGSIIAFGDELRHALNPDLFYVEPEGQKLGIDQLTQMIYARHPGVKISYIAFNQGIEDGRGSYEVYVRPLAAAGGAAPQPLDFDVMHIDPYTGAELGRYDSEAIAFDRRVIMQMIAALHEQLLGNAFGPRISGWFGSFLGLVAMLWILDTFVAGYISLPRSGSWLKMVSIKWSGSAHRLNFDLHRSFGTVLIVLFLMLAVSGAYWLADFGGVKPVEAAFGTMLPPAPDPALERPGLQPEMDRPTVTFGQAIRIARTELDRQKAAYGDIWDSWPDDEKGVIYVEHYLPDGTFGPRGPVVAIDARNGAIIATYLTPESRMRAGNNVDNWMYALHSGRILGFWGRVLISLTGLACAALCVTGFLIWRKKAAAAGFSRARNAQNRSSLTDRASERRHEHSLRNGVAQNSIRK